MKIIYLGIVTTSRIFYSALYRDTCWFFVFLLFPVDGVKKITMGFLKKNILAFIYIYYSPFQVYIVINNSYSYQK